MFNHGLTRNDIRIDWNRFWSKIEVKSLTECWNWTGYKTDQGYGRQFCIVNDQPVIRGAHRLSYLYHHLAIPKSLWVLHRCHNPPCQNPMHLYLGTHEDNMRDMVQAGRSNAPKCFGSQQGNAKLNEDDVESIRLLYAWARYSITDLASRFKVSNSTIQRIIRNESWTHVRSIEVLYDRNRKRLSKFAADNIRALRSTGVPVKRIASQYNVSADTIRRVLGGKYGY